MKCLYVCHKVVPLHSTLSGYSLVQKVHLALYCSPLVLRPD